MTEKIEPSPLWKDCEHFRMSEREYKKVQVAYRAQLLSQSLIPCAIQEVEAWLAGETPGARKARKNPTHYRHLYSVWAIQKAFERQELRRKTGGNLTPSAPGIGARRVVKASTAVIKKLSQEEVEAMMEKFHRGTMVNLEVKEEEK